MNKTIFCALCLLACVSAKSMETSGASSSTLVEPICVVSALHSLSDYRDQVVPWAQLSQELQTRVVEKMDDKTLFCCLGVSQQLRMFAQKELESARRTDLKERREAYLLQCQKKQKSLKYLLCRGCGWLAFGSLKLSAMILSIETMSCELMQQKPNAYAAWVASVLSSLLFSNEVASFVMLASRKCGWPSQSSSEETALSSVRSIKKGIDLLVKYLRNKCAARQVPPSLPHAREAWSV